MYLQAYHLDFLYSANSVCLQYKSKQINHLKDQVIGFYNRNGECLLCGTNWIFRQKRLRFVRKGLN
jgi:hypothetical protein